MKPGRYALTVILALALIAAAVPTAGAVTACPAATTLEELVVCLKDASHLPRSGSNDFVVPTLTERLDWADAVTRMLDGSESGACPTLPLPASLDGLYGITTFVDASDGEEYCVLAEIAGVGDPDKKAWGTFITRLDPQRELAIQIPHPLNDSNTPEQGASVFKTTGARSFLLSGAHRNANDATSSCQSSYKEADAAHNVEHMFAPTTEATLDWYQTRQQGDELVVIQFHGMGSSTCSGVDAYMTYGRPPGDGNPVAGDQILDLEAELEAAHPSWVVIVPGESPTCTLNATTNTQGRFLNGVAPGSVCGTAATSYSGRFIHIEQKFDFRAPEDWVDPIEAAWTVGCVADQHFEEGAGGWVNDAASTCSSGAFVADVPTEQSSAGGVVTQVGGDHTTAAPRTGTGQAFYTATNTSNGSDDVDGGVCVATSPVYPVNEDSDVSIWYFHGQSETGDDPGGDYFLLEVSTDGGSNWSTLASIDDTATDAEWTEATTSVAAGASVQFRVQVSDGTADGSLIEGGVDDVSICPSAAACTVDGDCDDGLYCNGDEVCNGGTCEAGIAPDCDDAVDCTTDVCDEASDACDNTPDDNACDNGFFCDGDEACDPVLDCQPGTAPDCDDGVSCTADACDETADACDNAPDDGACGNGVFCDGAETCDPVAGCQAGADPCPGEFCDEAGGVCIECLADGDCDDGLYCNGGETCAAGTCQAGTPPACDDGIACTGDSCNETTDACDFAPNNGLCDNGSFCDGTETCDAVLGCQAGAPVVCDDAVGCTADSCDEAADACAFAPDHGACQNGAFCDGAEVCNPAAGCEAGGDPCAGELCDEGGDACVECLVDGDCDDGLYCNGAETCAGGACQAGSDPCPGLGCDEGADVCTAASPVLWMSFRSNTAVPGVGTVADDDIVSYDQGTGLWQKEFDGSDVGLSGLEISALAILPDGDLLLSFTAAGTVGGLAVDDSDIVRFTPTSMGPTTAGTFSLYFDGSDVALTSNSEDVDGIAFHSDGRLIVSTTGSFSGSGASGADEDLFLFTGTVGSSTTSGSFVRHFDGSDVGLGGNSAEDVDAAAFTVGGNLLFSTIGNFAVTGLSGTDEDVVEFAGTFGTATSGSFSMRQDLSTLGIASGEDIGSLHLFE